MPDQAIDLLKKYVDVSQETCDKLIEYQKLIEKWQPRVNLIGPDTLPELWNRHFLDSLQLINSLPDLTQTMVDFGSGAGFPGMALAMAGATNVHLIESDSKKATFLKEVARITDTKVTIHNCRIEDASVKSPHIILSRACAELKILLELSFPCVSHETACFFHKGKNYSKEIMDAESIWVFKCNIIPSVTDSQGAILKLTNIKKRGL